VRGGGTEAFARATAAPVALVDMLWRHVAAGLADDGPDARAALRRRLRELVRNVRDPDLRREYGREFRRRLGEDDGPRGRARAAGGVGSWARPPHVASSGGPKHIEPAHHYELLVPLILTPRLIEKFEERIASIQFQTSEFEHLKNFLLDCMVADGELTGAAIEQLTREQGLGSTLDALRRWPVWQAESRKTDQEREVTYAQKLDAYELHRAREFERSRSAGIDADGAHLEHLFRALNGVLNRPGSGGTS
jgi:DNA primase